MINGSPCSRPPLSVKPHGAPPCRKASTSNELPAIVTLQKSTNPGLTWSSENRSQERKDVPRSVLSFSSLFKKRIGHISSVHSRRFSHFSSWKETRLKSISTSLPQRRQIKNNSHKLRGEVNELNPEGIKTVLCVIVCQPFSQFGHFDFNITIEFATIQRARRKGERTLLRQLREKSCQKVLALAEFSQSSKSTNHTRRPASHTTLHLKFVRILIFLGTSRSGLSFSERGVCVSRTDGWETPRLARPSPPCYTLRKVANSAHAHTTRALLLRGLPWFWYITVSRMSYNINCVRLHSDHSRTGTCGCSKQRLMKTGDLKKNKKKTKQQQQVQKNNWEPGSCLASVVFCCCSPYTSIFFMLCWCFSVHYSCKKRLIKKLEPFCQLRQVWLLSNISPQQAFSIHRSDTHWMFFIFYIILNSRDYIVH